VFSQDASNDILVDLDTKRFGYDQRNPRTTEAWIAAFEFDNDANELLVRALGARLCLSLWGKERSVLSVNKTVVKFEQCRCSDAYGDLENAIRSEEKRPEAHEESVGR
jgi:hypothetical protein